MLRQKRAANDGKVGCNYSFPVVWLTVFCKACVMKQFSLILQAMYVLFRKSKWLIIAKQL